MERERRYGSTEDIIRRREDETKVCAQSLTKRQKFQKKMDERIKKVITIAKVKSPLKSRKMTVVDEQKPIKKVYMRRGSAPEVILEPSNLTAITPTDRNKIIMVGKGHINRLLKITQDGCPTVTRHSRLARESRNSTRLGTRTMLPSLTRDGSAVLIIPSESVTSLHSKNS